MSVQKSPVHKLRPPGRNLIDDRLGDEARFIRSWLENPRLAGAIAPSGRFLARAMAQCVDPGRATDRSSNSAPAPDPVTQALLARGVAAERLVLVEYEPSFCNLLRHKFPRVKLIRGDAYRLAETLAGHLGGRRPAAIVSSLPLLTKPEAARLALLRQALDLMGPNGRFIQFTYGVKSPVPTHVGGALHFRTQALAPIWLNLPPARIYIYRHVDCPKLELPTDMIDKLVQHSRRVGREIRDELDEARAPIWQAATTRREAARKRGGPGQSSYASPEMFQRAANRLPVHENIGNRPILYRQRPTNSSSRSISPMSRKRRDMVATLGDAVSFYKIGMELAYGGGLALVEEFSSAGKQVFVDLKLHDIGNTVEKATAQIARLGARFLTVHAFPQTLAAAQARLRKLAPANSRRHRDDLLRRCRSRRLRLSPGRPRPRGPARATGPGGRRRRADPVAGGTCRHAGAGRPDMLLVTPGIGPAGAALGDQKRVATPARGFRDAAPIISWWAGRSSRPTIRAPPRSPSSAEIARKETTTAKKKTPGVHPARRRVPSAGGQRPRTVKI